MGFMDKAKKLAEQAQEKLDDVQGQVNKSSQGGGAEGSQGNVRYDQQGRPIEEGPSAGEAPPPSAEPPAPAAEAAESEEERAAATEPAPPPAEGGAEANPDPFKPIQ